MISSYLTSWFVIYYSMVSQIKLVALNFIFRFFLDLDPSWLNWAVFKPILWYSNNAFPSIIRALYRYSSLCKGILLLDLLYLLYRSYGTLFSKDPHQILITHLTWSLLLMVDTFVDTFSRLYSSNFYCFFARNSYVIDRGILICINRLKGLNDRGISIRICIYRLKWLNYTWFHLGII